MTTVLDRLRPALRSTGWPGALALLFALAALVVSLVVQPWLARQAALRQADAQQARERVFTLLGQRAEPPAEAADERFRAAFPAPDGRGRRIASLLEHAGAAGVASRRSDYRVQLERDIGLARVRVDLPASGSYAALRRFVETSLADDPALALDAVRLRRVQPNAAELQAEFQFGLWMNAGGDFARPPDAGGRP